MFVDALSAVPGDFTCIGSTPARYANRSFISSKHPLMRSDAFLNQFTESESLPEASVSLSPADARVPQASPISFTAVFIELSAVSSVFIPAISSSRPFRESPVSTDTLSLSSSTPFAISDIPEDSPETADATSETAAATLSPQMNILSRVFAISLTVCPIPVMIDAILLSASIIRWSAARIFAVSFIATERYSSSIPSSSSFSAADSLSFEARRRSIDFLRSSKPSRVSFIPPEMSALVKVTEPASFPKPSAMTMREPPASDAEDFMSESALFRASCPSGVHEPGSAARTSPAALPIAFIAVENCAKPSEMVVTALFAASLSTPSDGVSIERPSWIFFMPALAVSAASENPFMADDMPSSAAVMSSIAFRNPSGSAIIASEISRSALFIAENSRPSALISSPRRFMSETASSVQPAFLKTRIIC